jgi:tetratricopeptide (TPR) repeat protein
MARVLAVLTREWPLVAAVLAIASLALLPRFARSSTLREEREQASVDELRRRVALDPVGTEPLLRAFIALRPESRQLPEAHFLLGQAIVLRARAGDFPGPYPLGAAWNALTAAREGGYNPGQAWALQREIARLLDERGYFREAVARYSEIHEAGVIPEVALDLALALAKRALYDPSAREALLDEAAGRVSEYLHSAPPELRLVGFLTQSNIYWRAGRVNPVYYQQMLSVLDRELAEFPHALEQGRLQLERGKALTRLRRDAEALQALDRASDLLGETPRRDQALLFKAVLLQRAGSAECVEVGERLFRGNSPLAPVARLVLGLHELDIQSRAADPLGALSAGLAEIRRPAVFEETGFDFDEFYDALRHGWERESDRAMLHRYAGLYRDLTRLYPASTLYVRDHARLWLKAGEHEKAADRFLAAAALVSDPAERVRAVRDAADACALGKDLHARAASLYRRYFDLQPRANTEGLYLQALELERAGCVRSPVAGGPDALTAFADFVSRAKRDDPLLPSALLHRGRLFAEFGLREDAVEEFGRIVGGMDGLAVDPEKTEWAEALLGRGRALLELVASLPLTDASTRRGRLASEGRGALREYLERYGERFDRRAGVLEACSLLARMAIAERDWPSAMEALVRMESMSGSDKELRQQAGFLKGDALLAQGLGEQALEAYSAAYRADLNSNERLWGLIGRSRAYLQLGRREEARRDYENGRAIYDGRKDAFDKSLAGRGREVWGAALEALGKEILP